MDTIINILVMAGAFYFGARLLEGVKLESFVQAIILAIVIALLNISLGLVLKIVTLGLLSVGIFTLILDAIIIMAADYFLKGFSVKNFWWALGLAAVVAVMHSVFNWVF